MKSLKAGRFGALLEVELCKICTTPVRESDLESKSLKTDGLGVLFAWQAQGFRHVANYVAGAGVCEGCKNVGRRGGFEEGPKSGFSRGRRRDFQF